MIRLSGTASLLISSLIFTCIGQKYEPNWESLDARPLPSWYDEAKVGIFIHWGVFAVPSFQSEWFWWYWKGTDPYPNVVEFMKANYKPDWTYADFAKEFTVQEGMYSPDWWAELFNATGARYVIQVTKHHEGFASYPSKYSFNWNSVDVGPHRNLVDDISTAVRKYPNMRYGVYHSNFEWFNHMYIEDKKNNFTTQEYVRKKSYPELFELVHSFKPDIFWIDGSYGPMSYWNSTNFLAWLYNESPIKDKVVVNDRWGTGSICHHGGYLTCKDRYNPRKLQKRKFENAMSLDKVSWSFRRNAPLSEIMSIEELVATLVQTVSCNGNILINVGPTKDGIIAPIFEERFRQLGSWLGINGEAIYATHPWTYQNDSLSPDVWYTSKTEGFTTTVYAITLKWPVGQLVLGDPVPGSLTHVSLLGYDGPFAFSGRGTQGMDISVPPIPISEMPCKWAWVFKLAAIVN